MTVDSTPDGGTEILEAQNTLETMPIIESEEELNALLGVPKEGEEGAAPAAGTKPVAAKAKEVAAAPAAGAKPAAKVEGEAEEEEEGEGEPAKKATDYPSLVHYLNEQHKLNLNLSADEQLSVEDQAAALDEVVTRMVEGTNDALKEYQYIEELMADPEIQSLLKAKSEGKGLKDLYGVFAASPLSLGDDDLALRDFKTKYPKSSEEAIRGMIDSLKKSSQFEPFVKSLREQHVEEQSFSEAQSKTQMEQQAKLQRETEKRELEEFSKYVGSLKDIHGVPLTNDMKQNIVKISTQRDEKGNTYLDNALQSNEGVVLASLGIAFMKEMIQNSASLQGNRKNAKLIDKLFKTADSLQSGSGANNDKEEENLALLDRF